MNCWKSINLTREYGYYRIVLLSMIVMFGSFVSLYLPFSMIHSSIHLKESGFPFFLAGLLILPPVHKLLHCLPVWLSGRKVKIQLHLKSRTVPQLQVKYCDSMPKRLFMISVAFPVLTFTTFALVASWTFPGYMHYFVILASLHIGLSVTDFIYLIHSLKAPKKCFVQDFDGGYDILIDKGLR